MQDRTIDPLELIRLVLAFQIVEQTEFYDDASFQPFRASGKPEPYSKRCTATRLNSAEKLMYICKDQLALEREYEQRVMTDGRFVVDGFLVLFDVSLVPDRSVERQVEVCAQIMNNILKAKKPLALAATKCDEADEILVRELERLVNRKEFKGYNIPVIETSAHENINVDHAFFTLAQLIDKTRGRSRIVSYMEAAHIRRELLDMATEGYVRLLRQEVRNRNILLNTYNCSGSKHALALYFRFVIMGCSGARRSRNCASIRNIRSTPTSSGRTAPRGCSADT